MKIKNLLLKLYKLVQALTKLIPTLLEVIEDFSDDGKLNKSHKKNDKTTT